jgi:hypothetical protein
MKVEAIALSDFVHGDITATEGRIVRHRDGSLIESGLAEDLERAGLLRIKTAAAQATAAAPGKPRDDGQGQLSSASQAAPASQQTTSNSSKAGSAKTRKDAA